MISWLIQRFIPNSDKVDDLSVRARYGTVASVVCIVCNTLLCLLKAAVGVMSGAVSVVADALNNLTDASSNLVALLGFKVASKPADANHPYGHGRSEYLAGLMVATLIMVVGIELVRSSIEKILSPEKTELNAVGIVILLGSVVVKLWMARLNSQFSKRISSTTLEATAQDSRNDAITTSAVLVALVLSELFGINLDGWAGLAVGLFIVWSGYTLVRETMDPLLGSAPESDYVEHIRTTILNYPGVLGTHDLMVHDYGPGRKFASAHVEMAAEVDPLKSHDTIDNIENDFLQKEGLHLVLHYDPIVTNDPELANLRNWIDRNIKIIDPELSVHDLRIVPGPTHTNVLFDCVKPHTLKMSDDELRGTITGIVRASYPSYQCVITIDQSYLSAN